MKIKEDNNCTLLDKQYLDISSKTTKQIIQYPPFLYNVFFQNTTKMKNSNTKFQHPSKNHWNRYQI